MIIGLEYMDQDLLDWMLERLEKEYPPIVTFLTHSNVFELLVAVILSAQCTDAQVNKVTPNLFARYTTVSDFADADPNELEEMVRSTGFYRNKAKNIKASANIIVDRHSGKVPDTMEELLKLPGVARKTANIVLGTGFGIVVGIAVDTHVRRLSLRMGLTINTDPNKIEKDLMLLLPKQIWGRGNHMLIQHGRAICPAKKPLCDECLIMQRCPKIGISSKDRYAKIL